MIRILLFCTLVLTAPASRTDGMLDALTKAEEEIVALQAEQAVVAQSLTQAQEERAASQARADRLAADAQQNADGIAKANTRLATAAAEIEVLNDSLGWWRLRCIGLGSAIAVYLFLRLSPWTRAFVP